ncbi:MAG TPA: ribonuclease D [Abditibacteriaceae bacterium]|jgi:ribonuclease D
MLINHQETLVALCQRLKAANAPIGIDTEFISEKRYYAKLCLVQVYCEYSDDKLEALIDPFAVDIAPLLELISDESVTKIVHAGGQDLQIFFANYGCTARHVFDTQIAAAFLGYGHQAGYTDLVRRSIDGPTLSKKLQFTDWAARPLSKEQMEYALDDVRYLPTMYRTLRADLVKRGRLAWAQTEFRRAEARASNPLTDEELYQRLNLSGLSRRDLATLRELASTREELARSIDKPPSFVVPDLSLVQLAKHPPRSVADLKSVRGMPGVSDKQARVLLEAVERASKLTDKELPPGRRGERPDPQLDAVAGLLGVVAGARAADHDISRTYLAAREQLTTLAAWWLKRDGSPPPDLALLTDWRRELLGQELLDLLDGKLHLAFDATPDKPAIKVVATD